jgi:hypothetical protein
MSATPTPTRATSNGRAPPSELRAFLGARLPVAHAHTRATCDAHELRTAARTCPRAGNERRWTDGGSFLPLTSSRITDPHAGCSDRSGTYYVMVHGYGSSIGTYSLTVQQGAAGGGTAGDPCAGGIVFQGGVDTTVSYQPQGNYLDNSVCSWTIDCATGQAQPRPPVVTISEMDLESDYEYACRAPHDVAARYGPPVYPSRCLHTCSLMLTCGRVRMLRGAAAAS